MRRVKCIESVAFVELVILRQLLDRAVRCPSSILNRIDTRAVCRREQLLGKHQSV